MKNLFADLKRRNVYKVAIAYIVGGWALSQGIAKVFPVFDVPNWAIRLLVTLIIAGLPVALEKAYEAQDVACWWVKVDQLYDSVRNEPRFQALLKKVGL